MRLLSLKLLYVGLLFGISSAQAEITEDLASKERKPLYEIGIGAGSGFFSHYPASDQGQWRSLILPTLRYRGSIFRADEEDGVRAKILSDPRYGIELSGAGILPVPSDANSARIGMPDLDLLGEAGPQLYFILLKNSTFECRFFLPVRVAASTNFSNLRFRGYTTAPGIDFRKLLPKPFGAVRLKLSTVFASREYQEYYYDVSEEYVTSDRNAHRSDGGYLGARSDVSYSAEWDRIAVFFQVGYQNYKGARNSASPLFRSEHNLSGLVALRWLLFKSNIREDDRL